MALQLIKEAGRPIAAPSANPFGYVSPTTAEHVREQLGDRVDLILDGGPCEVGLESTIISFSEEKPRLLRPGGLPLEEIESVIGRVDTSPVEEEKPSSPGRLPRHYAPRTPIVIEGWQENLEAYQNKKMGLLAFREVNVSFPFHHVEVLSPERRPPRGSGKPVRSDPAPGCSQPGSDPGRGRSGSGAGSGHHGPPPSGQRKSKCR